MVCTVDELMVAALAREIPDGAHVQVGAGVPLCLAAAALAKATHAPNCTLLATGIGGIESRRPFTLSVSMVEPAAYADGLPFALAETLGRTEGQGAIEPLAPAQIDQAGNINTLVIGNWDHPTVRLPGIAGVDVLSTMRCPLVLYSTRHSPRVLVDRVDVLMGAGRATRRAAGLSTVSGPRRLITNLAIFDFDAEGHLQPASVHPGVDWAQVRTATGFPLPERPPATVTLEPSAEVLRLLREVIDPFRVRHLEFLNSQDRRAALTRILQAEQVWLSTRSFPCSSGA